MKNRSLKNHRHAAEWNLDRIPSSIANEKKVSIAWTQHFIHHLALHGMAGFVLANGSMSSNQSTDCPARSASSKPKAKPQSLPRQRDIRRALIEADLVDTAMRDSAFPQSEAMQQVLSVAKNNMLALPGQLFYSTQPIEALAA